MAKKQPRLTKREKKALEPGVATRVVQRTADSYQVSEGVSDEALAIADEFFAQRDRERSSGDK